MLCSLTTPSINYSECGSRAVHGKVERLGVHAVSMVDLVVTGWKDSVQGTCWHLQRDTRTYAHTHAHTHVHTSTM